MNQEEQIIIPPKEIRQLIDETAQKVAQRGRQFEELFMKSNKENPDPYRNYYDQRVVYFAQQQIDMDKNEGSVQNEQKETKEEQEEFNFYTNIPQITLKQDKIIKMTAYYTAIRGEEFLEEIQKSKSDDQNFNFLKVNHPHFHYFTVLVDSYIYIMQPQKEYLSKILMYSKDQNNILQNCQKLLEQNVKNQKIKSKLIQETQNVEQEQIYEWDNFKIVATIDFNSQINFFEKEEGFDENKYKFNPQNAIVFDALKETEINQ